MSRQGRKVATLGPGDAFGELALLDKAPAQRHRDRRDRHGARRARPARVRRAHRRGPRASRASCSPAWPTASATPTPSPSSESRRSEPGVRAGRLDSAPCAGTCPGRIRSSCSSASSSALGALASGHRAGDHGLARRLADRARGLRQHPDAARGRVLRRGRDRCCSSSRGSCRCGSATTSAGSPTTAARPRATSTAASATSAAACGCRRCCAIPPPGVMHSFIYFGFLVLFIVTVMLEIDHQLPDSLKFLHGRTYQAYAFVGDLVGLVFLIGIALGDRAPLRPAALPHPHQDQARGRRDPRHVPRHRGHRLPRPRRCASRLRAARRRGRLREVVVRRLPALGRWSTAGPSAGCTTRTGGCGSCTSSRSSPSS